MIAFKLVEVSTRFPLRTPQQHLSALKDVYPEMWGWLDEIQFISTYELRSYLINYEYDTGFANYDIYIEYENDADAFMHRMRW